MGHEPVRIYTKGFCRSMTGSVGVWMCTLTYMKAVRIESGTVKDTTPNQIEMIAIIEALTILLAKGKPKAVVIYTSSDYVSHGFNSNLEKWIQNGWKTSKKKPIKNKAQWKALNDARQQFESLKIIRSMRTEGKNDTDVPKAEERHQEKATEEEKG